MNEPTRRKIPAWSWALLALPLLGLLGYSLLKSPSADEGVPPDGTISWGEIPVPPKPASDEKLMARGKMLFAKVCAGCHGDSGDGEGVLVAKLNLETKPANFTTPLKSIKLRSTERGSLPTDEDLFRTLTRGLPGTAMVSFRNLPEADRWALVFFIKDFWIGKKKWPEPKPLAVPDTLPKSDELMEIGRHEFERWCMNCHGPDGLGGTAAAFQIERTYPGIKFARNGGTLMLRGSKPEDIARTLLAGTSGNSPMMSFRPTFYGDDAKAADVIEGNRKLWGTAYYVRKLIEAQSK